MLGITDLVPGLAILHNGDPHVVVDRAFHRSSQSKAYMTATIKSLTTGKAVKMTYHGADKIEEASVERRNVSFLYEAAGSYAFMDEESFEQIEVGREIIGDSAAFLQEGMDCIATMWDGVPVGIQIPVKATFAIREAEPGVKGDSATGKTKKAILENGTEIQVPLFISAADRVVVDTRDGSYVERA